MSRPLVVRTATEVRAAVADLRAAGRRVGFVPTMGALHEGHATLMRAAAEAGDAVVVSIFVNPLQFGAGEDLDRYPRTLEADLDVCAAEGVALVFHPDVEVIYPEQPLVRVSAGPMGEGYEGASRPGHFDGVLTVVAKLFHLVGPDAAYFGRKDAQQLALITRMVRDLDFPLTIVPVETVRDPDGLALSSRNRYLSGSEREAALALSRALRAADRDVSDDPLATARAILDGEPGIRLDYVEIVDPDRFEKISGGHNRPALMIVAAYVGNTRLIDNVVLSAH